MAGNKKTGTTRKQNDGENIFAVIGAVGGKKKNPNKGFGSMTPEQRQAMYARRRKKVA